MKGGSGRSVPRHPKGSACRCYLPVLTGLTGSRRAAPRPSTPPTRGSTVCSTARALFSSASPAPFCKRRVGCYCTRNRDWRRGRDSNPRGGFSAYTLSRRACSTAPAPLRARLARFTRARRVSCRALDRKPRARERFAALSLATSDEAEAGLRETLRRQQRVDALRLLGRQVRQRDRQVRHRVDGLGALTPIVALSLLERFGGGRR
jgi:hypothetical protein